MCRTVSGYFFLGIYKLGKAAWFAKVLVEGSGSVEGLTHVINHEKNSSRSGMGCMDSIDMAQDRLL
jgi:hypothetical protein